MALSPFSELVLFLSAYSPLFTLFGLFGFWGQSDVNRGSLGIGVLAPVLLAVLIKVLKGLDPTQLHVESARPRDAEALAYVLTFVLPFVVLTNPTIELRICILLMLLLIGILAIRGNVFYVNPFLAIAGYRLFDVETATKRTFVVLTKRRYIDRGTVLEASALSDRVRIEFQSTDGRK